MPPVREGLEAERKHDTNEKKGPVLLVGVLYRG